tara:strand:+ start:65 stop:610 length:546 start_codon:yes stop_codon:yes gene_type:complete
MKRQTTLTTTTSHMYLSTHLIVLYFVTPNGEIKRPEHLIAWWTLIFSFLYVPDDKDRIELRSLCRLFRDALKPLPVYTWYPHPNYPTLYELMNKLNEMYAALPDINWEECTALETKTLVVGMKVRVIDDRWAHDSFKDATIEKENEDETFDIVFDDGFYETKKDVPLNEIQIQNVRCLSGV